MALKMEIYYLESKSTSAHNFGIVGDACNELLSDRNEARPFFISCKLCKALTVPLYVLAILPLISVLTSRRPLARDNRSRTHDPSIGDRMATVALSSSFYIPRTASRSCTTRTPACVR